MIKLYLFLLVFVSVSVLQAQAPPYIPYQAIARDVTGQVKANAPIQVEFKIFNTMLSSSASYDEVHSVTTNDFGYFNLRIGSGAAQSGTFSSILWQTGDVSYEVWVDMGLGFSQLGGRSGFLSVPYAMYAANSNPNPTLTINAPNTISNPALATYSIHVPSPTLSISGNSVSISNGNTIALPQYTGGSGISISGSTITNSAPNQTVNISGQNVSGSYPNYTINPTASSSITSGNSNITVLGSAPAYTLVNTPSLSISADQLSISNGNTVTIPTTSITQGSHINVSGSVSNYTISAITPTLITTGNASISGSYPNQIIDVPSQTLSISGNTLNLSSGGGNVVLPSSPTTTITQGTNILIGGSAPNYTISAVTPTLVTTGNASISGSYPSQIIDVPTQTLSISGNTLNLSLGGGNVVLPSTPITTITQGTNVVVNGTAPNYTISAITPTTSITQGTNAIVNGTFPNYTVSAVTPTLQTSGNVVISGAYPTQTITVAPTSIAEGTNVTVSGTSPNYTISAVTPTLNAVGNASITGAYPNQTIGVPAQTLSINGNTVSLSAGGGSVNLPVGWYLGGNSGTSPASNFIGTSDAADLVIKTNNAERMRVTSTGSIGIGTTAPTANFDINTGNIKLGAGSSPFSVVKYGTWTGSFLLSLGNNAGSFSVPGAQVGDVVVVTLNSHNASSGSISLNNAYISSANTLSYNVNTSVGLLVTMTLSYIIIRP